MLRFLRPVKTTLGLLTVAGLAAILIACGGGSSGGDSSGGGDSSDEVNAAASRNYAGAGSRWDVSLDDGDNSFTAYEQRGKP